MRLIVTFLFALSVLFAQATFTLPGIQTPFGTEPNLSVTVSGTAVTNLTAWIASNPPTGQWPNSGSIPVNTTLAAAVTSNSQTTFTLTSAANLTTCNGLLIDSELVPVVGPPVGNVVTVLRNNMTAAATHLINAPVTVVRNGNYTCQLKSFWADAIGVVTQVKLQGAAITAQTAAIAAANASIASTVAQAVQ